MSISFVLVTFLFQLAVGMMVCVSILPPGLIDRRFFKSIAFWAFLFTGAALVLQKYSRFSLPEVFGGPADQDVLLAMGGLVGFALYAAGCLALWARVRFTERPVTRGWLMLLAGVGIAALFIDALLFRPEINPLWAQNLLLPLHFLSAALVLGGFLAGMIFGHWYLANTDMPKRLLVTMANVLIAVLALRWIAVGLTLVLYRLVIRPQEDFLASMISFAGHGIFFWERVLVGLVIPAVVVAMIWKTARIGSNQSATGIMYVAISFVFIGELVARYLFLLSAIPL